MAKPKIDKAPIVSYLWKRNVHKKYVMIPNAAPVSYTHLDVYKRQVVIMQTI